MAILNNTLWEGIEVTINWEKTKGGTKSRCLYDRLQDS